MAARTPRPLTLRLFVRVNIVLHNNRGCMTSASIQFVVCGFRNGRYYAQFALADEHTGQRQVRRVPLEGSVTPAQANQRDGESGGVFDAADGAITNRESSRSPLPKFYRARGDCNLTFELLKYSNGNE